MPSILDLTSLKDALRALDKSLGFLRSKLAADSDLHEQFRAAAIQAFEFTYEAVLPAFAEDVRGLLTELEQRNRAEN